MLNLPGWIVREIRETKQNFHVLAETPAIAAKCPSCHQDGLYRHGTKEQLFLDLPAQEKRVRIYVGRQRYLCRSCRTTFWHPLPDVDELLGLTIRLREHVQQACFRQLFVDIADDVGIEVTKIRRIFRAHVRQMEQQTVFEAPRVLGIDEVHLTGKPRCILTNIEEATVIGLLVTRQQESVYRHLVQMPNHHCVQVVCMDMWNPYRHATLAAFPKAAIVIDKFHVVRIAAHALDMVRKSVRNALNPGQRRQLMRDRFLLLKRGQQMTSPQRMILETW